MMKYSFKTPICIFIENEKSNKALSVMLVSVLKDLGDNLNLIILTCYV